MRKVGILGGTFNPIHNGHIELAKKALKEFGLETVIFVPVGTPPHKSTIDLAPKKCRLQMISLAISEKKQFKLSKIEINKSGYSYAYDTFQKLKKRFGKKCVLYYIMGLDSINSILSWKKPIELFKLCEFIVATRPGTKIRTFKRVMKFPPISVNKAKIHIIELKMHVSSSAIREGIKRGKDVSKSLPKEAYAYIKGTGIYSPLFKKGNR